MKGGFLLFSSRLYIVIRATGIVFLGLRPAGYRDINNLGGEGGGANSERNTKKLKDEKKLSVCLGRNCKMAAGAWS